MLAVCVGGFRSDLSITCMIDGNFGNVSAGFFFFEGRVSTKTVVTMFARGQRLVRKVVAECERSANLGYGWALIFLWRGSGASRFRPWSVCCVLGQDT